MYPDWELNQQPFGLPDNAPTNGASPARRSKVILEEIATPASWRPAGLEQRKDKVSLEPLLWQKGRSVQKPMEI